MEWLAGEKTKVVGTFPPRNRGWTGYVEKDTAGQTNIYSVEVCGFYPRKVTSKIQPLQPFIMFLYMYLFACQTHSSCTENMQI